MDGDSHSMSPTVLSNVTNSKPSSDMAAAGSMSALRTVKRESSMRSYKDMSYRDKPATPNSPSGTTVTTMYDHLLSPPSPGVEEEKDDRLRNDLLDEICNDMGIDDSMDLDFDDFCYNGQQQQQQQQQQHPNQKKQATTSTRFSQMVTPHKGDHPVDGRRSSAVNTSNTNNGYTTSDSLCAIAKLTQSITSDNTDTDSKRSSPEAAAFSCKQEVSEENTTPSDSEHGKPPSVNKVGSQRQRNDCGTLAPSVPLFDGRRKSEDVQEGDGIVESSQHNHVNLSQQQSWPPTSYHSQPPAPVSSQRSQSCVDYSYQDDYTMEDMTAPDTMINFSEMPQQPNYYQLPQGAGQDVAINFNMSLHPMASASHHPGYSGHAAASHQQFPRGPFGCNSQTGNVPDIALGRASPQLRNQSPFQGAGPQQHGNSFQQCLLPPGSNSSVSNSMQSQSQNGSFHRSDSFQGRNATECQPPSGIMTIGQQSLQKSASSVPQSQTSTACGSSSPASSTNFNSSQQGFMQRLVTDKSSAFRSHPLFPLLRDLIIADMNFHEPTFPHQLIRDLPTDFNKLLKNYLSRNPPRGNYPSNQSVESVVMDALKYAHHTLIEKIQQKKSVDIHQQHGSFNPQSRNSMPGNTNSMAMSSGQPCNVSDYCEKFDDSLRHNMQTQSQVNYNRTQAISHQQQSPGSLYRQRIRDPVSAYGNEMTPSSSTATFSQPLSVDTGCDSPNSSRHPNTIVQNPTTTPTTMFGQMPAPHYHHQTIPPHTSYARSPQQNPRNPYLNAHGPPCPPPNYTVSPNNPPLPRHQQTMYDMGPPSTPSLYSDVYASDQYGMPPPNAHQHRMHHHMGDRHLIYMNNINDGNLVKTMMEGGKDMYCEGVIDNGVLSSHSLQGAIKGTPNGQGKQTEGRKHASLPKEAVNIMLNWLREHQDKPYPNDDEKGMLIKQTGLSITQINYWFTNARRRLLPKWRGEDM